jgi:phosphoadenosine phosphosulfate reductase
VAEALEAGQGTTPDLGELARISARLEGASPQEILTWAVGRYGRGLTLSVSFGNAEGMILLDMLSRIDGGDEARVFTLDTGFMFEETVRMREEATGRYGLPIEVVRPKLTVAEQAGRYGKELYSRQPDLCCRMRKVEPQERALRGYDGWLTGLRRDQTPQRARTPVVGWEGRFGVAKIAPLASWTAEGVRAYAKEHDVPLNPLLEQGYKSIGCEPCTRPVAEGEDARAGR